MGLGHPSGQWCSRGSHDQRPSPPFLSPRSSRHDQPRSAPLPFRRPRPARREHDWPPLGPECGSQHRHFSRIAQSPRNWQSCGQPTSEAQLLSSASVYAAVHPLIACCRSCFPVYLQPLRDGSVVVLHTTAPPSATGTPRTRVYRIAHRGPCQTVIVGPVSSTNVGAHERLRRPDAPHSCDSGSQVKPISGTVAVTSSRQPDVCLTRLDARGRIDEGGGDRS
jgi:hypothetical protein